MEASKQSFFCVYSRSSSLVLPPELHLHSDQQWRNKYNLLVVVVQSMSCVRLFVTSGTTAHQTPLFFTIYRNLLQLISIESVMPSHHLTLCHPLLLLPSIFLTITVFSIESALSLHQVAEVLELQLQHQSFSDYSGLISFRIDLFDLLAVQGTLESLLQQRSSKASILGHSIFFMVQLSHPYMSLHGRISS